jgi:hypothetical protein
MAETECVEAPAPVESGEQVALEDGYHFRRHHPAKLVALMTAKRAEQAAPVNESPRTVGMGCGEGPARVW